MQTAVKLGILIIAVGSIAGVYTIFFFGSPSPTGEITIRDVIDNPGGFAGQEVTLQGELIKDPSFGNRPFLLSDGDGLLPLLAEESLDGNVGLGVRVRGVIDFNEQAVGRPRTTLRLNDLEVVEGTPTQFIEFIKLEIETSAQAGTGTHVIIDNSGNLLLYDLLAQRQISTSRLESSELQQILETLIENRFFELSTEAYTRIPLEELPGGASARDFTYILKVITVSNGQILQNEITWVDTSFLPGELLVIQEMLNDRFLRNVPGL